MRTTWNFNTADQLVFGQNAIDELGERTRQPGVRRMLVVTDETLVGAGLAERHRPLGGRPG